MSLGPVWRERKAGRPFGFEIVVGGEMVGANFVTVVPIGTVWMGYRPFVAIKGVVALST